jgi:alkenylglycerophosphocholine/alkenylglycerophosphoethanolamine hydrolase
MDRSLMMGMFDEGWNPAQRWDCGIRSDHRWLFRETILHGGCATASGSQGACGVEVSRLRDGPGWLLAAVALAAAAVFFFGLATDRPALRLATKAIPALTLGVWVATRRQDGLARLVTAGLVLSGLGDLLLEKALFFQGLVAFLLAHVAYVLGFVTVTTRPALVRALPIAAWCGLVLAGLGASLGDMAGPVTAYIAVVGTMMWRAAARVGHTGRPTRAEWLGLAGALLFGLSDTLIAVDRFVAPLPEVRWPIMLLYWSGQWGIAASAASLERTAE